MQGNFVSCIWKKYENVTCIVNCISIHTESKHFFKCMNLPIIKKHADFLIPKSIVLFYPKDETKHSTL